MDNDLGCRSEINRWGAISDLMGSKVTKLQLIDGRENEISSCSE